MRERWSSRTVFIFAAIGSAVGIGNIWRFPYISYEYGGGAFLIPFIISLFIFGIPLLMLEFSLGQRFQKGAVYALKSIHPKLGGFGLIAVASGFVIVLYYAVILAWSLVYLVESFSFNLPWASDTNSYFNSVLGVTESISNIGGINWILLIALFFIWVSIFFIVRRGVLSIGKVVFLVVALPMILLLILFIRGITLPGALSGIIAYIAPDFSQILNPYIWLAAISQIFFSFSIGFGVMVAYASFNRKEQNVKTDSYITGISDALISFFAGFVVFSILGYMAFATNVSVADVATSGHGLAFIVFPEAISLLPLSWLFSIFFFLILLTLGIGSAFSIVEAVNTTIADRYENPNRPMIAFFVCLISFLLGTLFVTGAGVYFLDIVDHFAVNYGLITAGLLESIAVGWIYGAKKMRTYINNTCGCNIGPWWDYIIKFVVPIALIVLLGLQLYQDLTVPYGGYPAWALAIGWSAFLIPLILSIIYSLIGKEKKIYKKRKTR